MFSSFSTTVLELTCVFIVVVVSAWYFYYLHCFQYWKKKGVPTTTPQFPTGHILKSVIGQENIFLTLENYYNKFKSKGYKHGGLYFFNGPVYLPIDPELIKCILTTDFEYFADRGVFPDEENFPLSVNMFTTSGPKWKNLRSKLSPTFTSGKLKTMYEIFIKNTENFIDLIEPLAKTGNEINIKQMSMSFSADIVLSTAFGLDGEVLKNPDSELSRFILTMFHIPIWRFIKSILKTGCQNPASLFKVFLNNKFLGDYFGKILKSTIKHREENQILRKDFLTLLLEVKEGLTFNEILSQAFLFFFAGFETSSQAISLCIHELAHNQDIQDRLRKELLENLGTDFKKYSYEDISRLPYLDKVFNETLRIYPASGFLNRMCVKPFQVPGTNVTIDKGTSVLLSILGLHHDPEYFPDPLKFDPERFNEDQTLVPYTFLPFGEGPRICIGMRYGKLLTKLGIAALVSHFKMLPSPKTPKEIHLEKVAKSLLLMPDKGIFVKIEKLQT